MKYVKSFESFKYEPVNEEFIGGLFKNLKNKLSLGFSKQFGSAKKADAVIDAYKNMGNISVPIIVRLQGTNAIEAKKLIDESGLKVQSAVQLSEAADLVKQAVA